MVPTVPPVLLALTEHRWNVPVLARLHPDRRAAFGELATGLDASRDALQLAITSLRSPGWVDREPGRFGAFLLTEVGRLVAAPLPAVVVAAESAGLGDLAFRRWTLPVLAALDGWTPGFSDLRAVLPDVSPRALTLALKDMKSAGLVVRRVVGGFPPRTEYDITALGRRLALGETWR